MWQGSMRNKVQALQHQNAELRKKLNARIEKEAGMSGALQDKDSDGDIIMTGFLHKDKGESLTEARSESESNTVLEASG